VGGARLPEQAPGETVASDNSARIDILLADFTAVREEIASRSAAQNVLLNLAIISAGAVAGFVITRPDISLLAIVVCFSSSFLGALWLDHARVITVLGTFVSGTLWPQLRELAGANLATHEDWAREQDAFRLGWLVFVAPIMGLFLLPPIGGLAYSYPAIRDDGSWPAWTVWLLALAITGGSAVYWTAYYLNHAVLTRQPPAYDGELLFASRAGRKGPEAEEEVEQTVTEAPGAPPVAAGLPRPRSSPEQASEATGGARRRG
jgi:hypothetical protein